MRTFMGDNYHRSEETDLTNPMTDGLEVDDEIFLREDSLLHLVFQLTKNFIRKRRRPC